ncbi:MAG TPA: 4'-phosphopantetheinyl transferase superfamily protein [Vicinamibacterales bacterium]|nr:4'-phosphopantetheinyl transferase superfamily protein [Vicinamibacterales bacterium]
MTPDDALVVWQSTSALGGESLAEAIETLADEERERCAQIRFAAAARDYAAAHALLRRVLSRGNATPVRDWRFTRGESGKPLLIARPGQPAPSFSLSHTHGLVACAIAASEIGVDVELTSRPVDTARIADRFFSRQETLALDALDGAAKVDRFFDLWLLKEALVKALGRRMATSMRELAFVVDESSDGPVARIATSAGIDPTRWAFRLFTPTPGYRGAVAARYEPGHLRPITIVDASSVGC